MRLITIKDTKAAFAELILNPKQSHRVGDSWVTLSGLGEKSVLGRVALEGKSAAHDQITERKYSVAQMAIISIRDPAILNGPRHRFSHEQPIYLLPEGAIENSPRQAQRSPGNDSRADNSPRRGESNAHVMGHIIQRLCKGFTPPRRGGNLSLERLPRVSPWAIFLSSLREELHGILRYSHHLEVLVVITFLKPAVAD
jgi:hypothetical protein